MYIRTKDGVYEVTATPQTNKMYENSNCYQVYDSKHCIRKDVSINDIINQSENLVELCDGFYIDEGNEFSFYEENAYEDFEEAKKDFFTNFDNTSTLYAFIKTTKGLIYVAKMDNEGKLVLI